MAVGFSKTNKPLNPRGNDASPKGYNRAALYSGKALDFDGVNDELILDGFTMSGNVATLSFYLKADDWDANSFIFAAGTPEIVIGSTTGGNNLSFYDSSSWQTFGAINDTTSTNFFSIVFDGTTAIAYMNGVKFGDTLTITAIDLSSVTGVKLMAKYTGGAWFFNGQLSGFKIFNTALTAAQVSDLYNNPEKVVPTGVEDTALKLWLPMMEGAGTTAYDGSGNGNHGTISGATWTHGVGSPVAQTAVIDWNKGTNILQQSNAFSTSPWLSFVTLTSGQAGHDGTNNAWKIEKDASSEYLYQNTTITGAGVFSVYAKAGSLNWIRMLVNGSSNGFYYFDLENGVVGSGSAAIAGYIDDIGNGWYRCSFSFNLGTVSRVRIYPADGDNDISGTSGNIYIQDAQAINGSSVGPYIPTLSTAQTSDVLLPQGLTTGRDITGVNLFENVRKQGALNLDGNSWAEVHDNASLDFTSGMSLECWVQIDDADGNQHILGKWDYANSGREYLLYYNSASNQFSAMFGHGTSRQFASFPITATGQWFHFVGTTDGSTITPYVNGVAGTTEPQTTALAASDIPVTIGMENTHAVTNSSTKGPIAQPRIYNRALTAAEVLQNYNSGKSIYTNS